MKLGAQSMPAWMFVALVLVILLAIAWDVAREIARFGFYLGWWGR